MDKVVRMEVKRLEEETILIRLLLKINLSIESIAMHRTKKLKICPKMRYRKLKILDQTDQTDQIEYERVGARTVKHAKLPNSSFDQ